MTSAGIVRCPVKQQLFARPKRFDLYLGEEHFGCVREEEAMFYSQYFVEGCRWWITGNILKADYSVAHEDGIEIATVKREFMNISETYAMDVADEGSALRAIMVVLCVVVERNR